MACEHQTRPVWAAIHRLAARQPGGVGVAPGGRFAGLAGAASFIVGGVVIFAAAEWAGYQGHADGAKTALILGHILYANPISALRTAGALEAVGHGTSAVDV